MFMCYILKVADLQIFFHVHGNFLAIILHGKTLGEKRWYKKACNKKQTKKCYVSQRNIYSVSTIEPRGEKAATLVPKVWTQTLGFWPKSSPHSLFLMNFKASFLIPGCLLALETLIFGSDITLLFCLPSKQNTNWFFKC